MLRNYLKIAIRNVLRHKGYAVLNVAGLAIGIGASILIYLVVTYELSYDKYHSKRDKIYQVVTQDKNQDGISYTPGIPYIALDALRTDFPQVHFGALYANFSAQVTIQGKNGMADKKFLETPGIFFTEPEYFEIYDYKWLAGSHKSLSDPNTVILTKTLATKYFNNWQDAVGKYIKLDNNLDLKITGIIDETPLNSDFRIQLAGSYVTFKANPNLYGYTTHWGNTTSNFQVFMLLPQGSNVEAFNAQLKKFGQRHYTQHHSQRLHFLQPLKEIHFDSRFGNLGDHVMSKATLWTLSFIGVLIIIMACINFINLSTAQAVSRSREVGVRKVLGGSRIQLLWQMMGETTIIVLGAIVFAIGIAAVCLPFLNKLVTIPSSLPLFQTETIGFIIVVTLLVIVLSGFYPAVILSGFKPVLALKNKITSASIGGISIRRGLVILQFAISQVLVIGTIIAIAQMNFVHTADLGFNKEAILVLNGSTDSAALARHAAFKEHLLKDPTVKHVTFAADVPSSDNNWATNFSFDNKPDPDYSLFLKYADADYFTTFDLEFLAGRPYKQSDTATEVVINETLMKKLGFKNPEEIIGKPIRSGGRGAYKPIVGVVRDFKTNSLREEVKPLMISSRKRFYSQTSIKLSTSNLQKATTSIQSSWERFFPEYVYNPFFLDENIERFYRQETQLSTLYKIFAGLAIFISCLGLYGLVSFMAVQKTKEVGVRKVLGASVTNIVYLFSKEFTILILIAFLLATPVAYYMMKQWLQNFVYRINISVWVFIGAIAISIIIAWITVGYKAVRAAVVNPVKSLRSE